MGMITIWRFGSPLQFHSHHILVELDRGIFVLDPDHGMVPESPSVGAQGSDLVKGPHLHSVGRDISCGNIFGLVHRVLGNDFDPIVVRVQGKLGSGSLNQ